jgi:hypothetical protein
LTFAAEEASSIMFDEGVVNLGDVQTDVQDACGQPSSRNYEQNASVYKFGPSQPVYTAFFKEGNVVKMGSCRVWIRLQSANQKSTRY